MGLVSSWEEEEARGPCLAPCADQLEEAPLQARERAPAKQLHHYNTFWIMEKITRDAAWSIQ